MPEYTQGVTSAVTGETQRDVIINAELVLEMHAAPLLSTAHKTRIITCNIRAQN